MDHPLERIRRELATHLHAREAARFAEAYEPESMEGPSPAQVSARTARAALGGGRARDAIESCVSSGMLDAASHGAMLEHLADAARDEIRSRRGIEGIRVDRSVEVHGRAVSLGTSLRELLGSNDAEIHRSRIEAWADAIGQQRQLRLEVDAEVSSARATIQSRGPGAPDHAPADLVTQARTFLARTEDAMRELSGRARIDATSLVSVFRSIRHAALDSWTAPRGRAQRFGRALAPLGFERPLERVRLVGEHRLCALSPAMAERERGVVIAQSPLEFGLVSELFLMRVVTHAVARRRVSRALPIELRRSRAESIARGLSELIANGYGDRLLLRSVFGFAAREAEAIAGPAAHFALLRARFLAARVLVLEERGTSRIDSARAWIVNAAVLREAAGPAPLFDPVLGDPESIRARFRGAQWAFAMHAALRARFDEDWLRNPRAAGTISSAMERGGSVSIETLMTEWKVDLQSSFERIDELAR